MIIFKTASGISSFIKKNKSGGQKVGFIPTMGALHDGHISLIEAGKRDNPLVVCSIFVNPSQFNNPEDFKKYPSTTASDIEKLERAETDLLFLPSVDEMYPPSIVHPHYELGYLETILEGKYRPGHFQGVCHAVDRLISVVKPDVLYLGQKDFQQCMVLKKLLELKNFDCRIEIIKTMREADGLAMSSRNVRLSKPERETATNIYKAMLKVKEDLKPGSLIKLKEDAVTFLTAKGFKVDYVEIADSSDLKLLNEWDGKAKPVVLVAAFVNEVRLIDNLIIE